jgi:hypothetical protein
MNGIGGGPRVFPADRFFLRATPEEYPEKNSEAVDFAVRRSTSL